MTLTNDVSLPDDSAHAPSPNDAVVGAEVALLGSAKILLIDDEAVNLVLLTRILNRAGYTRVESTTDPREALTLFEHFQPDLVCTDLNMPFVSGLELLTQLANRIGSGTYLPILMLTADTNPEIEERALAAGAKDFLNKPFKMNQIKVRVANLLQTRFLHLELKKHSEDLEGKVRERTRELETARLDVVERLALASEYRDYTTGQHTGRVGALSAQLARGLGFSETEAELLQRAASLHDIGKIGIPDDVLLKPGKLSAQEWTVMKTHVELGAKLLARGGSRLVQLAETVALTHHERYDGSGYPRGLAGDDIPLSGQIVAVADVFDTLTHVRPYKPAWSVAEAIAEIENQRGKWFSPRVVDVLLSVVSAAEKSAAWTLAEDMLEERLIKGGVAVATSIARNAAENDAPKDHEPADPTAGDLAADVEGPDAKHRGGVLQEADYQKVEPPLGT